MKDIFYRNRRLTVLVIGFILVAGIAAFGQLPRQEDPAMTSRFAAISTYYPGASAERVEALVTEKIEVLLTEIEEIKEINSTSRSGFSLLKVELEDSIKGNDNAERIWSQVRDKLSEVVPFLPEGALEPELDRQKSFVYTVMVALTWDREEEVQLDMLGRYAKDLDRLLSPIAGTTETKIFGAAEEEIIVTIKADILNELGLSAADISRTIARADSKNPAGQIQSGEHNLDLEVRAELTSIEDIRSIILRRGENGTFLRVGDVADVKKDIRRPVASLALLNGKRGIVVGAKVDKTIRVDHWVGRVEEALDEFYTRLPDGVTAEVIFNQDVYTQERLGNLLVNILLGAVIIIGVMVFMMGWRAALLVATALPFTVLMVLAAFNVCSVPLHQMSITGLIIALGLLIDNAIVAVDEYRKRRMDGHTIIDAIGGMASHLFVPLLASTLTTSLTFMPIILAPGPIGEFIGSIGIAVILSLVASLFLALTIIPALAGYFDRKGIFVGEGGVMQRGYYNEDLKEKYRAFLVWSITKPYRGILMAIVLPISGFLLAGTLVNQFFPPVDRDQFQIQIKLPAGTGTEETLRQVKRAREVLATYPEITQDYWFVGETPPAVFYNVIVNQDGQTNSAGGFIKVSNTAATHALLPRLQQDLMSALPNAVVLTLPFEQGPPFEAPVEINIYGNDLKILAAEGEKIRALLAVSKNVTYTQAKISRSTPKLNFVPNEDQVELAGLELSGLASQLNGSLEGTLGGTVLEGTEELPIRVRLDRDGRSDLSRVMARSVTSGPGSAGGVPLMVLGSMELVPTVGMITRRDGERINKLQAHILPFTLPDVALNDFQKRLAESGIEMPEGYRLEVGGESKKRKESEGQIFSTVLPLMVIMMGTLVLAFNSFTSALIIGSVAFLSAGLALLSLRIFGFPMGFTGIMGTMGLIGLAINDSIVVLAALRANERARAADADAIVDTVVASSRHIFSTTFTTVGGFLPLIVFGSSMWPPLATAISGGMVGATLLALIYVPNLYFLRVRRRARKQQKAIERAVSYVAPAGVTKAVPNDNADQCA